MRTATTTLAAAALLAVGGPRRAAARGLTAGPRPAAPAAAGAGPVQVRTQVIHRTRSTSCATSGPSAAAGRRRPPRRRRGARAVGRRLAPSRRRSPRPRRRAGRSAAHALERDGPRPAAASTSTKAAAMTERPRPLRPPRPGCSPSAAGRWPPSSSCSPCSSRRCAPGATRRWARAPAAAVAAPAPRRVLVAVVRRVIVKRVVDGRRRRAADATRRATVAVVRLAWPSRAPAPAAAPGPGARSRPAGDQDVMTEHELTFRCMGSRSASCRAPWPRRPTGAGLDDARAWLASFDARLSRFRPDSELCALNATRAPPCRRRRCCARRSSAGLWAAQRTGGLVDPTLCRRAAQAAGYAASRAGVAPAGLRGRALAAAPAAPRPRARTRRARWRRVRVDDAHGAVRRPPGVELDTGGTGKGLAADAVAHRLAARRALRRGLRRRPPRRRRRRAADALRGRGRSTRSSGEPRAPAVARPRRDRDLGHRRRASGGGRTGRSPTTCSTRRPARPRGPASSAPPRSRRPRSRPRRWPRPRCCAGPRRAPRCSPSTAASLVHDDGDVELAGPLARARAARAAA